MLKIHIGYLLATVILLGLVIVFAANGGGFAFGLAMAITSRFYAQYWYISLVPLAIGLGFSIYRRKISYSIIGLVFTVPMAFFGSFFCSFGHHSFNYGSPTSIGGLPWEGEIKKWTHGGLYAPVMTVFVFAAKKRHSNMPLF